MEIHGSLPAIICTLKQIGYKNEFKQTKRNPSVDHVHNEAGIKICGDYDTVPFGHFHTGPLGSYFI